MPVGVHVIIVSPLVNHVCRIAGPPPTRNFEILYVVYLRRGGLSRRSIIGIRPAWTMWHFGHAAFWSTAALTPPSRRSAMPRGVSAAGMTEAGDVRDEDLVGAEGV